MAEKSKTDISRKRKRVSKKTKKSWRKHSDVKDVEEFLDESRKDEITGISEKKNNRLFFVDAQESEKQKRNHGIDSLKCHRPLCLDSSVPALHISKRVSKKVIKSKIKDKLKTKSQLLAKRSVTSKVPYDLWAKSDDSSKDKDDHFERVCKIRRVKPPSYHALKPSTIQSLEAPLPGTSYNPSYEEHQDLLKKALEVEEKKEREEKRLKRSLDDMFPTATEQQNEYGMWLKEMSSGLTNDDDDDLNESVENDEDEDEATHLAAATRDKKKTEKMRRQEKERLKNDKKLLKEKEAKLRDNQKFRLKSIKRDVKRREFKLATRAAWKELEKESTKDKPKRLGKLRYTEPTIPVKLSEELSNSLRLLKPEGHVAELMFKSLQKKNIIEPRLRAKPLRTFKSKLIEKKGHKSIS